MPGPEGPHGTRQSWCGRRRGQLLKIPVRDSEKCGNSNLESDFPALGPMEKLQSRMPEVVVRAGVPCNQSLGG